MKISEIIYWSILFASFLLMLYGAKLVVTNLRKLIKARNIELINRSPGYILFGKMLMGWIIVLLIPTLFALLFTFSRGGPPPVGLYPSPPPPPPPPIDETTQARIDREIRKAWDSLSEGLFAYPKSIALTQGVPKEVAVRITSLPAMDMTGIEGDIAVDKIHTSASMSASLTGDSSSFRIISLSSERQALAGDYTDWRWRVTALEFGSHILHLKISARIWLSNDQSEAKDVVVYNTPVAAKINAPYIAKGFILKNWMWCVALILSSPVIIGFIAWVRSRLTEPKKEIGF